MMMPRKKAAESDDDLRNQISDILATESLLAGSALNVYVEKGSVRLDGKVDSFKKGKIAEAVVKTVHGVKAIDNEIEFEYSAQSDDILVREQILSSFKSNWAVPEGKVCVLFQDGCLTLTGDVEWNFQRLAAELAASDISGVKYIFNRLTLRSGINYSAQPELPFYDFYF
jgi:osmotically-inducible protein OsmY